MEKVLITGASGFVGGFLVEEALRQGFEVHAGIRKTSNRAYLTDDRIRFFVLDFENTAALSEQIQSEGFNYIIHNAGITKADGAEGYMTVNYEYTCNLISAIRSSGINLRKFIFISSLAAYGPADLHNEDMVSEALKPMPLTAYGRSKLAAEEYIRRLDHFPYLIFRPTVIYGPREQELLSFYKMVNSGLEAYIGRTSQELTFVYVKDLSRIIIESLMAASVNTAYFISDGKSYSAQYLGQLIRQQLGRRTLKIHVPLPIVKSMASVVETLGKWTGKYPMFNREKVKELESLNWKCDIRPLVQDLGFQPQYLLETGVVETINWYKKNNWL